MAKETTIINYHTSGETAPLAENLDFGELAIKHNNINPSIFVKKNNGELAQFVDKDYIDNVDIAKATLIVDIAANAGTYDPSWAGGGSSSEDNVQNGFVVLPTEDTDMDKWYSAENKKLLLDIKEDAREAVFGKMAKDALSSLVPCELSRVEDDSAGPMLIYQYRLKFAYLEIEGLMYIDQYEKDENAYGYSYNFNPYAVDPIQVTATLSEEGSYTCTVSQEYKYVSGYVNAGKKLIEVKRINGSNVDYLILDAYLMGASLPEGYFDGVNLDINGLYCTIPNIENGVVGQDILILTPVKGKRTTIGSLVIDIPDSVNCVIIRSKINPSDYVKAVNGQTPDNNGNVQITSNYIKNYATRAEYDADTTRQTPNVCYIEETDELIYNN